MTSSRVLISDPIAEDGVDILRQEVQVDFRPDIEPADLLATIGDYEALIVRSRTKVTASVIEAGKQLRVIGRAGMGVDNIDVPAATQRGIVVVNAPTSTIVAVAEHTIGLMLALARHIPQADASLRQGEWQRSRFVGVGLSGKTLGIVGLGRIGTAVTARARGLGMEVIAHDPYLTPEQARERGGELVSLEDLLARADFVSIHVPLMPATRGLIGATQLALMKPTAYLINCARGGIVDEEALSVALEHDRLAGAALDVFAVEPPTESPLLRSKKVVLTPHLGASTREAQREVAQEIAAQVLAVLRGKQAQFVINPEVLRGRSCRK